MKKILLASVLKPCDDTRMYEKFGISLSKEYNVFILGRYSESYDDSSIIKTNQKEKITTIVILKGESSILKRLGAVCTFLKTCFKLKPKLIIVHSPELLPALAFYQFFSNAKTVYDVRENYFNNIVYQNNYPLWFKPILASLLRFLENMSRFYVNGFILAERCYNKELTFHRKKFIIVENKFVGILNTLKRKTTSNSWHFAYTGTISVIYGIWKALDLIRHLHSYEPKVRLTIIGHAVNQNIKNVLLDYVSDKPYITLLLGEPLVKHSKIIDTIQKADFVLLPYLPNKSTVSCIPTKLYECLALQKPMLIQHNDLWAEICNPYPAALFIDFDCVDIKKLHHSLQQTLFYNEKLPYKEVSWKSEEKKLLEFISDL